MENTYDKNDTESIVNFAKQMIGLTFREIIELKYGKNTPASSKVIDAFAKKRSDKGNLGKLVEECHFGYTPNSIADADFPDAKFVGEIRGKIQEIIGLELKVTPYEKLKKGEGAQGYRAGERLKLTSIDYNKEIESFYQSHLWKKCQLILLVHYFRKCRKVPNRLVCRIDYTTLFSPSKDDLGIIIEDYRKIVGMIETGRAHELTESMTNYLGAATSGQTAKTSRSRQELYGDGTLAQKRAFVFKQTYMTEVLREYVISGKNGIGSKIIQSPEQLNGTTFRDFVLEKINRYRGMTVEDMRNTLGITPNEKNKAALSQLALFALSVRSNRAREFEKAGIVVKSIRVTPKKKITESMSLPPSSFDEMLTAKEWEDSDLCRYMHEHCFLLVVFSEDKTGRERLSGAKFWSMPAGDIDGDLRECWLAAVAVLKRGIELHTSIQKDGKVVVHNNLPEKKDNRISHMRPHASKAYYRAKDIHGNKIAIGEDETYGDELPDGNIISTQSFWLNNTYVLEQIRDIIGD